MVKRENVKPGFVIKVVKQMPGSGSPGPAFKGKLEMNERLEVLGTPYSEGGLNLVKLRRHKTNETVVLLYAFVTNFCRKSADSPVPSGASGG